MSSRSELEQTVAQIREILSRKPPVHEAIVRQGVVLRILFNLGFDIWNIDSVSPEETNSGGFRPDFIVRHGAGVFVIEIKGSNVKLQPKDFQQTINYIGSLGIRYAILTNGITWYFVDERLPGKYEDRIIFVVDIFQYESVDFTEVLSLSLDPFVWGSNLFHFRTREIVRLINNRVRGIEDRVGSFIPFYYKSGNIEARAVYDVELDTWTVLAGSTGFSRLIQYGDDGLRRRREKNIAEGKMVLRGDGMLEFLEDIVYYSASSAMQEVVGGHRNGWMHWTDKDGNKAIKYKPSSKIGSKR